MMWNPPWTSCTGDAVPTARTAGRAQPLWLVLGFLFVGLGADWSQGIYDGPARQTLDRLLLLAFDVPAHVLRPRRGADRHMGVAGNCGVSSQRLAAQRIRRLYTLDSAAAVLLAIKPHLVYLFWIALIIWGILAAIAVCCSAASLRVSWRRGWALARNPRVFHQYWEAMTQAARRAQWKSPDARVAVENDRRRSPLRPAVRPSRCSASAG